MQDRYGGPQVLRLEDVPVPRPAADELLVRVHAASVNAHDWHVMRGDPLLARAAAPDMFGRTGPRNRVRGRDIAGVVESVGHEVTSFRPGDEVYGDLGNADGAFAEYACVPLTGVAAKPARLNFEQAAAIPLAGTTALMALRDAAALSAGQHLLINGASGGVGTFAIQVARALGTQVTAVCSTRNVDLARSLGAHHVVDYTGRDFTRSGGRYDVVLDLVGNHSLTALRRSVRTNGTIVLSGGGVSRGGSVVGPMGLMIRAKAVAPFLRPKVVVLPTRPSAAHLQVLGGMVESGELSPILDRTYDLPEAAYAIRHLETEHARGKVVIRVTTQG